MDRKKIAPDCPESGPELLTRARLARKLDVSVRTVDRWIEQRRIPVMGGIEEIMTGPREAKDMKPRNLPGPVLLRGNFNEPGIDQDCRMMGFDFDRVGVQVGHCLAAFLLREQQSNQVHVSLHRDWSLQTHFSEGKRLPNTWQIDFIYGRSVSFTVNNEVFA